MLAVRNQSIIKKALWTTSNGSNSTLNTHTAVHVF